MTGDDHRDLPGRSPASPPGDLAAALAVVPAIADHTASLYEMTRTLKRISEDTDALPPLRADMGRVAEATDVLSDVDAKLKTISEAMPVLVEVQRHLDQLPETMADLDAGHRPSQAAHRADAAFDPSRGTRPGEPPRKSCSWPEKPLESALEGD